MNFIWVKTNKKYKDRVLLKCYKNQIFVYETKEKDSSFFMKIAREDFERLKKFYFTKFKVVGETGIPRLKQSLKKYRIFLLSCVVGLLFFYFLSHIMVKVEVIHSNKEIRDLLRTALEEKGIKKNTWKKNFLELEQIKEEILNQYPTKLEWMEIEVKGMNYIIRVEERKIVNEISPKERCNLVATKDGFVKKLIYSKGEAVVKMNDYVKKGDLLISGILSKEEETKSVICATGSVYAEVWYKATIKIPKKEERVKKTGKNRWNFKLKNNSYDDFIFKSRLDSYITEEHPLVTLFGSTISFVKQWEVEKEVYEYQEEELEKKALSQVEEKIRQTLSEKEEILMQKVLKKSVNNSTMDLEVFVVVLEQIGEQQEF